MQDVMVTVSTNVEQEDGSKKKFEEECTIRLPEQTGGAGVSEVLAEFGETETFDALVYGLRVKQMGKKRNELIAKHDPDRGGRAKATILKARVAELSESAKAELAALLGCDVEDLP